MPVGITKVNRLSNVATVVTAANHGLSTGDSVTITGVGFGFNGAYTVTSVPNATTFTYSNAGANTPVITQEQMSAGVATMTTNSPTTLSPTGPDTTVTVSGLSNIFNIVNAAVTAATSGTFSYNIPAANRTFNVTKKGLQGGQRH